MTKAWAVTYQGVIRKEDGEDIIFAEKELAMQNMKICSDRWPAVKRHHRHGFQVVSLVPELLADVGLKFHYGERALCTKTTK